MRGGGGLTPSAAGRALRPHAEQVLHAVALARQAVQELRPTSAGALQIAAALSICAYLLPAVLQRFRAARPRVLALVQHRAAPRGPGRRVRLDEVADRPLILFDRGSSDWTLTHGLFRRAGLLPNVTLEVETIETAKRMVERGLGLAFLSHLAVAPELRRGALTAIDIADAEPLRRSLDVVHPRHRSPSPDALAFLDALRAAVHDVEGTRPVARRRRGRRHVAGGSRARRTAPGSGRSRSRRP